jgi:hypothetical protein
LSIAVKLAKTYAALKAAGVSDADAQATAEELADYENRLASIEGKLTVLIWAVGINAAAALATFGMLWQLASTMTHLASLADAARGG